MKFVNNSAFFMLCPVIVVVTDVVVTRFLTAGATNQGSKVALKRYGSNFYNTSWGVPK